MIFFCCILGGLSLLPPRSQGAGNIMINSNSTNSMGHYPMDCDPPSVISIQPSVQMTLTPSSVIPSSGGSTSVSLNVINQRYLQHMHTARNNRYNAPPQMGSGQKSNYAPASLPIDLIQANSGTTGNSLMVLPDHHLNAPTSLIIGAGPYQQHHQVVGGNVYAPFDGSSIQLSHHQSLGKSTATSSRSGNSTGSNGNNNATGDESMVCVQSPVVIH